MAKKTTSSAETIADTVVVRCCLPQDLLFTLPDGRRLTIAGAPVSRLVGLDGAYRRGGVYGETRNVQRADWDWVQKTYGKCRYFQTSPPLLFAEDDPASADARAGEQAEARHGREQVDVWNGQGNTQPEAESPASAGQAGAV